jgi:hypothetical protein
MKTTVYVIATIAMFAIAFASCDYPVYYVEGSIKTDEVKNITQTTATCNGEAVILHKGGDVSTVEVTKRGFIYNTDSIQLHDVTFDGVGGGNFVKLDTKKGEGTFSCLLDELEPNTKYYVMACAVIQREYVYEKASGEGKSEKKATDGELHYGNIVSFTTK